MSARTNSRKNSMVPSRNRPRPSEWSQGNLANSLDNLFEDFRGSFNDMMAPFLASPWVGIQPWSATTALPETLPSRYPVIDVVDKGDCYELAAELPGFNKENIDVQVGDDVIQLKAEMHSESKGQSNRYVSHERAYSAFNRVIQFPEPMVGAKVEGTMKDGVLSMRIPKREPTSTKLTKVALK
jgi:HSP20 family molecular chaperone IbpA